MVVIERAERKKYIFILIFCLTAFYLYRPVFIDIKILKVIYGSTLLLLVLGLLKRRSKKLPKLKRGKLTNPVRLVLFSILFSMVMAYQSWGQSFGVTLVATTPYLSYLLYFYLRKYQVSRQLLERIVLIIGTICIIFYFFAFAAYPTIIFGAHTADEISDDRGFARIIIGGLGFIYLLYFLALNNYLTTKKTKWLYIVFVCLIGIFMTLTRQVIFSCLVLGMYLVYRRLNLGKRFIVFGVLASVGIAVVPNLKAVQLLVNQTQEDTGDIKDNIRYESAMYFLNDYSPDGITRIFGNGEPSLGNSYFGIYTQNVELDERYFQSDIGFIGFYSKFGVVGVIGWIIIFLIVIFHKFPPHLAYTKLFVLLVLFTGLTSSMPFNENYIPAISICLYLADGAMQPAGKKKVKAKYTYDWSQHLVDDTNTTEEKLQES